MSGAKEVVTVRVDPAIAAELRALAEAEDRTVSYIAERAIKAGLAGRAKTRPGGKER